MRRRDIGSLSMKRLAATAVLAVGAITAGSCGGGGSSTPNVIEIIVPAGTQDRLDRGLIVDVMPEKLEFRVGDTLRVRNDDDHVQYAGPYRVLPGEQFELQYGAPGRYGGLCDLSGRGRYEIVITE